MGFLEALRGGKRTARTVALPQHKHPQRGHHREYLVQYDNFVTDNDLYRYRQ
jgi:hypothetical protein